MVVNVNTELRKLRPAEFYNLGVILNISDNWKKLMASVTKDETENIPKFSGEFISIVEEAARQERKLAAAIFLEEWATMGRKRPTIGLLLHLLMKTHLFRAADYLAHDILKVAVPQRPSFGPAAPIDVDVVADLLLQQNLQPESASNNSDFALRTTDEIRLSEINYPIGVFGSEIGENLPLNNVDVLEIRCAESKSNEAAESVKNHVVKESSKIMTNLIKFNESENFETLLRSDLMKFDTEKIVSNEVCQAVMPNLSILRLNSSTNENFHVSANYAIPTNAEINSTELPTCLEEFGNPPELNSPRVDDIAETNNLYLNRELASAEIPLCIDSSVGVFSSNARDDNFTDCTSIVSLESLDNRSVELQDTGNAANAAEIWTVNSREIPVTVLELHNG